MKKTDIRALLRHFGDTFCQHEDEDLMYERLMRERCERYFKTKDLVCWKTSSLPCTTLEGLQDCGLITVMDTLVFLPKNTIQKFQYEVY